MFALLEKECEWQIGHGNMFFLHHKPTGSVIWFKQFVFKDTALDMMADVLKLNYC